MLMYSQLTITYPIILDPQTNKSANMYGNYPIFYKNFACTI